LYSAVCALSASVAYATEACCSSETTAHNRSFERLVCSRDAAEHNSVSKQFAGDLKNRVLSQLNNSRSALREYPLPRPADL
jgi:hypothetical protein